MSSTSISMSNSVKPKVAKTSFTWTVEDLYPAQDSPTFSIGDNPNNVFHLVLHPAGNPVTHWTGAQTLIFLWPDSIADKDGTVVHYSISLIDVNGVKRFPQGI